MSEIKARLIIPTEWSQRTRCPICSAVGMSVLHQFNFPDQLHCRSCGLGFELELGGNRLYVTCWPISLSDKARAAGALWLTIDELKLFVNQATEPVTSAAGSTGKQTQSSSVPLKNEVKEGLQISQEMHTHPSASAQQANRLDLERLELINYIKSLLTLGNTYKQIQTILKQKISSPPQLIAALEIASQLERQDQVRQQKKLFTSVTILVILIIIMVGTGSLLLKIFKRQASISIPVQATAGPTTPPNIVDVLKLDTPIIHRYPTLPASDPKSFVGCPRSLKDAASLFGGLAENWKSMQGGWIMISPVKAVTINVPNGMKAAYLLMGKTVGLAEVKGPAKMENVYYVSISCP